MDGQALTPCRLTAGSCLPFRVTDRTHSKSYSMRSGGFKLIMDNPASSRPADPGNSVHARWGKRLHDGVCTSLHVLFNLMLVLLPREIDLISACAVGCRCG